MTLTAQHFLTVQTCLKHERPPPAPRMHVMKMLLRSAMIFFGTLMAAGLVALGEPGGAYIAVTASAAGTPSFVASARPQR